MIKQKPYSPWLVVVIGLATVLASWSDTVDKHPKTIVVDGESYSHLKDLASFYGLKRAHFLGDYLSLRGTSSTLAFQARKRGILLNDMQTWLHMPTQKIKNKWGLTETDWSTVIDPILRSKLYLQGQGHGVVVLDPGHGGKDKGTTDQRALKEKTLVLDLARRIRVILANAGLKVYLTREGDRFIDLEERCRKAARWNADIFVSIHINAAGNTNAEGIETFILPAAGYPSTSAAAVKQSVAATTFSGNRFDAANAVLGDSIQRALREKTEAVDRGLRRARFVVLKHAPCPAALVECGFLSNHAEAQKLQSLEYRDRLARGISEGVIDYARAVEEASVKSSL